MYKVGIIGDPPENIPDKDFINRRVRDVLDLIKFQYGENLIINTDANIGTGHFVAENCMDLGIKYHIVLSNTPEKQAEHWFEAQKKDMLLYFNSARTTTLTCGEENNLEHIIDLSNFMIFFWDGRKSGEVYESIVSGLAKDKLCLDGARDLKLITKKDIG